MKRGIGADDGLIKVIHKVKAVNQKEIITNIDTEEEKKAAKIYHEEKENKKVEEKCKANAEERIETKSDMKSEKVKTLIKNIAEVKGSLPKSVENMVSNKAGEKVRAEHENEDKNKAKGDIGEGIDAENVEENHLEKRSLSIESRKCQNKNENKAKSKVDFNDSGKKGICLDDEALIEAKDEDLIALMNSTVKELKIGITDGLEKETGSPKSASKWWRKRKSIDVFDFREENLSKKKKERLNTRKEDGENKNAEGELEEIYEDLPRKNTKGIPSVENDFQSSPTNSQNTGVEDSFVVLTDLKDSDEEDDLARSLQAEEFEEESIEDEEFEEEAIEKHLREKLADRKMKAVHWKEKDMPKVKDMTKCEIFRSEEEQRKRGKRSTM